MALQLSVRELSSKSEKACLLEKEQNQQLYARSNIPFNLSLRAEQYIHIPTICTATANTVFMPTGSAEANIGFFGKQFLQEYRFSPLSAVLGFTFRPFYRRCPGLFCSQIWFICFDCTLLVFLLKHRSSSSCSMLSNQAQAGSKLRL